ncbi:MAG: MarR family transcriptional regulator [Oscillospiraceae bacterium]|nr:MarR family transcriptional regulator [Oscillospiraceae bacterium]
MHLIDVKILNTAIERLLNQSLSKYDITYAQATVIGYLKSNSHKIICQKDIEINLGLSTPTVNSILKRMLEKGMVEITVQTDDKRFKTIRLTEKSESLSTITKEKISDIQQKISKNISEQDIELFNSVIKQMINNINQG